MTQLPFITADQIRASVTFQQAVEALEAELRSGLDLDAQPPRQSAPISNGEWLLMPSQIGDAVGIKVLTVAWHNPARGLARIQGLYLLFDSDTLTPIAVLDGTSLTEVRTPAVSVAATRAFLGESPEVLVFGAGPQALGHVRAFSEVVGIGKVTHVALNGGPENIPVLLPDDPAVPGLVASADLILCNTTAREPLFDSSPVKDSAVVVAMGSHEPAARELDSALLARSTVIAEHIGTALREAGDIIIPVNEGALDPAQLVEWSAVARGEVTVPRDRPIVFKSTGLAWEDLVTANLAFKAAI
ncbi:MAG: ornithine cyclodeaminase family protein [Propionibacteriaceae bacterium]|jgi:ornithine cyclodeaminase|nr:ornithine cyclodeaminase family protein [Propionibacteriaceae bacterium]